MKSDYQSAIILEDSESDNENLDTKISMSDKMVSKKKRETQKPLQKYYNMNPEIYEIGVDEVGRGPLFGRVYTAAVILPKDDSFDHFKMKDSKKFHSKKKIVEVSNYIKENAIAWFISFEDEKTIDEINILQATQKSMHHSILEVKKQLLVKETKIGNFDLTNINNYKLLIDGNYFNPISVLNKNTKQFETIPHVCVEGGDNVYSSIAAASILAKVERDKYIDDLCLENPDLIHHYCIDSNKGYGAKKHIDGIKEHGITPWHRKTFGICKSFVNKY
jgi:ribonuclease HII